MRRTIITAVSAAALVIAGAVPAAAAMGQGPGHNLPNELGVNELGVNVLAHADTADYSLAFTSHTSKKGDAHGSIDFDADGVTITKLDLHRLALVTEDAATANGCKHGEMWIARGTALYTGEDGTQEVRVWVDLQDRDEASDLVRIRAMALKDHDGQDDGTDDHGSEPGHTGGTPGGGGSGHDEGTEGHADGADGHTDDHDDGHTGCGGGSPWLFRSHWFEVRDVAVHHKGHMKN
jgi:hypothetical protein